MFTPKRFIASLALMLSFVCVSLNNASATTWISAEGFYSLYRLAAAGNVEGLKASKLPIDGVNRDEDTGLCYSARRHNAIAWNAYLAAGANPNPDCAKRVPGYKEFAAASRVAPSASIISGTALAYSAGAVALIGGGVALASGGGGGGSGSSSNDCSGYPYDSCPTGYHETDSCTSGGVTKYKCEINDCSAYPYTACGTGYHEVDHCQEGEITKYKCEINDCSDYPYTSCPEGYHETGSCQEGSTTKYKCSMDPLECKHGGTWNPVSEKCNCKNYWTGTTCETCPSGDIVGDTCYNNKGCVHGTQSGGTCHCYFGWTGTTCNSSANYNNINNTATGGVVSGNTTTITKSNTGNEHIMGLTYVTPGNKAGVSTTLYNGYYKTDAEHDGTTDHIWIINASNSGTGETSGMYNNDGNETRHLYIDGTNIAVSGTYTATTMVNASGSYGNVYGLYSVGNITTLGGVNYDDATLNSTITVNSSGLDKTVYGLYSAAQASNNLLSEATASSSTITLNQTHTDSTTDIYGIKASAGALNEGTITINNYGLGTSYGIKNDSGTVTNSGTITTTNTNAGVLGYGIKNTSGTATNSGTITSATTGINSPISINSGKIVVSNITTADNLALYGIYGSNVTNTGLQASDKGIYVTLSSDSSTTSDRAVYGIYGSNATENNITNQGYIAVSILDEADGDAKAYGIYNQGSSSTVLNDTTGHIYVGSASSVGVGRTRTVYGIYSTGGTVTNRGLIDMWATTAPGDETATMYGIYATAGSIVNEGSIRIQDDEHMCTGEECKTATPGFGDSAYIHAEPGVTINNPGLMMSALPLYMSGKVLLSKGGSFEAPVISGDLGVSTNAVSAGFEDSYKLSNAIISENTTDLNLSSESAMFEASLDGQDVVLNKKPFVDIIENDSLAAFLENNYQLQNNEILFKTLKETTSKKALNSMVEKMMGEGLTRFAIEDMTMFKEVSLDINNAMFANQKSEFSLSGNTRPINFEKNLGSRSRWALSGKKTGKLSYGIGVVFTDISSQDENNNNSRKDEMFQMVMPIGYKTHGFELITTPRLGYAYGHYTRDGYQKKTYEGKIEKRIFGMTNEARYPIKAAGWTIAPKAEFNALGYRIKGHEEDKEFALNINKQNIWSVEGGIGFNVSKAFEFGKDHNIQFDTSVMMYHEFSDPYELELSMRGMNGNFKIRDEKRRNERIMVKNSFEYQFNPFSVYANLHSYIDSEYRAKADIGLKYAF